ncbi:5,10-methylene tetrahydromethanopterin reductase [Carbonactinospora thermoautotrophica]|uniref:5,10-methylene tetrahydromethanopterin reductase n=1 Tax=Carbonactinospora thermoautotrophica TaxID=1469144 RepID=A0A132NDI0_9ACTN|nr:TIGR03557 family F420-dependent LLM class oxidoreductase [Carbonactinospora thermoautotrophica]KWX04785.1 5,10-methylene tetrahydromethanopterin reductase [Carbonactinospora thermoautotrophica]KWX08191.1 5,10-methylene tetrahydromethanopterin reductase [Carbonactinospora thermoautotrophica]
MLEFGYTLLCEQSGPKDLVRHALLAEQAGFDFVAISDHYSPWIEDHGHSPYAWSVLGAVAQATERIGLMTLVTCPIRRYHPAVVAQKAATTALLSDGRFRLGLGSGENLNEHVVGGGWPAVDVRHEMLIEAIEIIQVLWGGDYLTYHGEYFDVESARVYDLPDTPPELGVAVSGAQSCQIAGEYGDAVIAVEPRADLIRWFEQAGGTDKPRYGRIVLSHDADESKARAIARDLWRWETAGWKVTAELPGPSAFEAYSRFVREEDITRLVSCGPDVNVHVRAVRRYLDAGFTRVALVQVGGDRQEDFIAWADAELLPALRRL